MADPAPAPSAPASAAPAPGAPGAAAPADALGGATYEVIRQRLAVQASALQECVARLDARRREVFGSIEAKLLQADRITTVHNCVPRDMAPLGHGRFLFGFNVQFGLKKDIDLPDVFALYQRDEQDGSFKESDLTVLQDKRFVTDFKRLYQVYERAFFSKFSLVEGSLYMVFQVGAAVTDLAVFKWTWQAGQLRYIDGRSESEYRRVGFPPTHEFRWRTPDRESFRYGDFPHVSIEDRVFVECIHGDLTLKIEDNTATGEGIYSEPVEDRNQKVDDAEIGYALVDDLIVLRIKPYKETAARHLIYNAKLQTAVRVDSIGQSCALLPEAHGLIFPDGYYLGTGELKRFESRERDLHLERVIHAPNGEDSLYIFYNPADGVYVLLPYRLTAQRVEERIVCHGFSLFPNGHLLLFRGDDEPQKHHQVQLRQTPFHAVGHEPPGRRDAYLYQVGNRDVVRCLAELQQILSLVRKESPYADLYSDLVKRCSTVLDAYPWLSSEEGFGIAAALRATREAADRAVDEFDKLRRLQREAVQRLTDMRRRCEEAFNAVRRAGFRALDDFVRNLVALRHLRGELISLREVRHMDVAAVIALEGRVAAQLADLSQACVKFLLQPAALESYRKQAATHLAEAGRATKVFEGRRLEQAILQAAGELEMLIEIVNSLRIEDPTEATRIIDTITTLYATLNQARAALKSRLQELVAAEGAAQFAAQIKLLGQSASSYLDLCTTPGKCDDYLNRLSVQIEELEGTFADFEAYTAQLAEKRTEFYEAFEQRKLALVEQRNRKAASLLASAERILKVIQNRLAGLDSIEAIHSYMASDLMTAKVRDLADQLIALEDTVKADDLLGRLKSVQQDAVRQLRDRQDLFQGGPGVIQLGKHPFNVNTQPLDLTVVVREDGPTLHLTSTKFFEPITDDAYLATRDAWDQEVIAETPAVCRAEYLAWQLLQSLSAGPGPGRAAEIVALAAPERLAFVQEFMAARYAEGYTKGVHDADGDQIFVALATTHRDLGTARFHPSARACAVMGWTRFLAEPLRALWTTRLKAFAAGHRLFAADPTQRDYIEALRLEIDAFAAASRLFPRDICAEAAEYLFHELTGGDAFAASFEADRLAGAFQQHLAAKGADTVLAQARLSLRDHPASEIELVRDWVRGFLREHPEHTAYLDEIVALVACGDRFQRQVVRTPTSRVLEGMRSVHPRVQQGRYPFDYLDFVQRLRRHESEVVPRFTRYHQAKQRLIERERARLRLDEFKPRVLTSFVRNQLIDRIYLPLVGDNLAKQIGAAGATKRTDLMGLLLLISPPGYGKTTLVEYLASRLGLVFVKINGPALGHSVNSLDPEEAPNAAARQEIHKLNLALEMGDNVMLCIDDIQHCNPEFLQKFISLCDAQRRIEGVWNGKPRTYDLRGRKFVVVMAGNPYTESGQRFKLPDMLANRADTYNLGDIIGGNADAFKASYLENAVTSNPVLAPLANRGQNDIRAFIRMAELGQPDPAALEAAYAQQEFEEIIDVLKKLVAVREVILRVNQEYIHSAAQADEFRTEPPFRLQGSYRNMNRLAEKIMPILNDAEVQALVLDHYRGESQTLTTGAEANLLKFKELIGALSPEEAGRWDEIKRTFRRNQVARGADPTDPVGRIVTQMSAFHQGLEGIQSTLEKQLARPAPGATVDLTPIGDHLENLRSTLAQALAQATPPPSPAASTAPAAPSSPAHSQFPTQELRESFRDLGDHFRQALAGLATPARDPDSRRFDSLSHELEMIHSTLATLKDLAAQHRDHLRHAQDLLAQRARQGTVEIELTQEMLSNERAFLEKFQEVIGSTRPAPPADAPAATPPAKP